MRLDTVHYLGPADEGTERQLRRDLHAEGLRDFPQREQVGLRQAGVNQDGATVTGEPITVLDGLVAGNDQPRPRLFNGEGNDGRGDGIAGLGSGI